MLTALFTPITILDAVRTLESARFLRVFAAKMAQRLRGHASRMIITGTLKAWASVRTGG